MKQFFQMTMMLAASVALASDTAREQTLQRAIDLVESKGDPAKAKPLFEDVSKSADKALAARALLYLAQAQERQGKEQARVTYERIVREFSSQTESVAEAQRRLVALGGAAPSGTLTARLVTPAGQGISHSVTISADGRWGVGSDWKTGDLIRTDMTTGKITRLLTGSLDKNTWTGRYVAWAVLSPDNKQIAFARYGDPRRPNQGSLWVMPNEPGAHPRLLNENPEYRNLPSEGWSADGKAILVDIERVDRSYQLAWFSVNNGSVKVLKSFDWKNRPDYRARLSPDGRYIAYSARVGVGAGTRIHIIASDGSQETSLTEIAGINEQPVWTPDGSHILFVSSRAGSRDLWAAPVYEGRAAGTHSLVKRNIGDIRNLGMTRMGSLYYVSIGKPFEYVSVTDIEGKRSGEDFVGLHPMWSPDGKSLAFLRHRQGSEEFFDLVVRSHESGEERVYTHPVLRAAPPRWLPDGKSLLVPLSKDGVVNLDRVFHRLDLKSGKFEELLRAERVRAVAAISSDGKTMYLPALDPKDDQKLDRIAAFDLASKQRVRDIPVSGNIMGLALSPDGRTLAITTRSNPEAEEARLSLVGVDGSGVRELVSTVSLVRGLHLVDKIAWTKDGRAILYPEAYRGSNWRMMRVPSEGGKPEATGFEPTNLMTVDLNADGSRIAISFQKNMDELWALDNLRYVWEKSR